MSPFNDSMDNFKLSYIFPGSISEVCGAGDALLLKVEGGRLSCSPSFEQQVCWGHDGLLVQYVLKR